MNSRQRRIEPTRQLALFEVVTGLVNDRRPRTVYDTKGNTTAVRSRPMLKRAFAASAVLAVMCGNSLHAQSSQFTVDFSWQETAPCFDPKSPTFSLTDVPGGTKVLRFSMKDLDAPNFPHGGGSIAYNGQSQIGRGAFSYQGPCPPQGQHNYRWTVEALDGNGKTLAIATIAKKFPER